MHKFGHPKIKGNTNITDILVACLHDPDSLTTITVVRFNYFMVNSAINFFFCIFVSACHYYISFSKLNIWESQKNCLNMSGKRSLKPMQVAKAIKVLQISSMCQ